MANQRTIRYMVNRENGFVYSQVGHEIAVPVLDFEAMKPENNFTATYNLEKMPDNQVYPYCSLLHTRKIPVELKNRHRTFWGMKTIKI